VCTAFLRTPKYPQGHVAGLIEGQPGVGPSVIRSAALHSDREQRNRLPASTISKPSAAPSFYFFSSIRVFFSSAI
jgi:hypothetical protein